MSLQNDVIEVICQKQPSILFQEAVDLRWRASPGEADSPPHGEGRRRAVGTRRQWRRDLPGHGNLPTSGNGQDRGEDLPQTNQALHWSLFGFTPVLTVCMHFALILALLESRWHQTIKTAFHFRSKMLQLFTCLLDKEHATQICHLPAATVYMLY